jgi:heptosyltransferase-3
VEDRWIETGRALLERVPRLVLSCGPDPAERALASRLREALGPAAVSTDGETTWNELAGLLHRARLFVGVDTAAMHLAAACNCPTVALFGGSKIFEWYPWRVRHRTVRARDWLAEGAAAALSPAELMREITTDRVVAACDEVLSGHGALMPSESRLVIAMKQAEG